MTKKRIKKFVEDGSWRISDEQQGTKMVSIAMLAAISTINLWHFRLCRRLVLKIDFSDIPILLGMFLYGPLAGVITAFVRSLLHLFLTGLAPQNMVEISLAF